MNYRFTDSDFPGGKGKPAWFHKKTTPPQKRRAWFDEYNRRASNGEDNRGESHAPDTSTLTEEIEVAKREHVRRAGNGGEDVPPGPTPEEQAPPKRGKARTRR
jgi:hypothetical protein